MNSKQRRRLVREFKPELRRLRAAARLLGRHPDLPYYIARTGTEHRNAIELRHRQSQKHRYLFDGEAEGFIERS